MSFLQVSIYMPPLKIMKNVVDRMKNLSNFLVYPFLAQLNVCYMFDPFLAVTTS